MSVVGSAELAIATLMLSRLGIGVLTGVGVAAVTAGSVLGVMAFDEATGENQDFSAPFSGGRKAGTQYTGRNRVAFSGGGHIIEYQHTTLGSLGSQQALEQASSPHLPSPNQTPLPFAPPPCQFAYSTLSPGSKPSARNGIARAQTRYLQQVLMV